MLYSILITVLLSTVLCRGPPGSPPVPPPAAPPLPSPPTVPPIPPPPPQNMRKPAHNQNQNTRGKNFGQSDNFGGPPDFGGSRDGGWGRGRGRGGWSESMGPMGPEMGPFSADMDNMRGRNFGHNRRWGGQDMGMGGSSMMGPPMMGPQPAPNGLQIADQILGTLFG